MHKAGIVVRNEEMKCKIQSYCYRGAFVDYDFDAAFHEARSKLLHKITIHMGSLSSSIISFAI